MQNRGLGLDRLQQAHGRASMEMIKHKAIKASNASKGSKAEHSRNQRSRAKQRKLIKAAHGKQAYGRPAIFLLSKFLKMYLGTNRHILRKSKRVLLAFYY